MEHMEHMEQPPSSEPEVQAGQHQLARWSAEEEQRRLGRLSPLLHDLIAWDLVYRTDAGSFVLRDEVQRRLAETSARQSRTAPEVYVGRPCQRCGTSGVTRMVDGVRLCDACNQPALVEEAAPFEHRGKRHRHDPRSRWGRKAG